MVLIALILIAFIALALIFALRLTRSASASAPVREVSPMKQALERRIREGAEFRM